ncbi:MCE family protein [Aldersonia sp. NBC_00410]|uniref:MCE family protein n=1 Tax=Aldersonia sp. NBC_00410 TaxID=2975954 RepID=UPI002257E167|nr:MCE family protein [Aldersonia sp. NBC_00410]MCX5043359.1 MCE family protein [Aldersonia sp. NBC_00410]
MENRIRIGLVGIVVAVSIVLATLQYEKLPFFRSGTEYTAEFADAGGLLAGDQVDVAGIKVGTVGNVKLQDGKVVMQFTVKEKIELGDQTSAAIKTNTVLGRKSLVITPQGEGRMKRDDNIPIDRTTTPYSLNDALGDLSNTVRDLDTDQLNTALDTMSEAIQDTPVPLREALDGVSRLSRSLNTRDQNLRELLTHAQGVTKVLADRSQQINALILDGNELFGELTRRRDAIAELISNISAVSQQLTGFVQDNEAVIGPALDKLNKVTALLQRNADALGQGLTNLGPYATSLGEAVGSGPYFQAFVQNYGSGKLFQPLIDAFVWPEHIPDDLRNYLLNPPPSIQLQDPPR